ncbi:MAG: hypothetical protein Q4G30_02190 [Actinomycetaceae bacterium]|nr:hypothetical protein [Actinomycetaceae bacterium]
MVTTLIRLKGRILINSWTKQWWRALLAVWALLNALGASIGLAVGAFFLGKAAAQDVVFTDLAFALTVGMGSAFIVGWTIFPPLAFGVDNTLDPANFTAYTTATRSFAWGLLLAGGMGTGGIATALLLYSTVVLPIGMGSLTGFFLALIAATLGILTCWLAARVTTGLLSSMGRTRRGRDVAGLVSMMIVFGALILYYMLVMPSSVQPTEGMPVDEGTIKATFDAVVQQGLNIAQILAYTPLGAAWAFPLSFGRGDILPAAAQLLIALATLVVLMAVWQKILPLRMLEPKGGGTTHSAKKEQAAAKEHSKDKTVTLAGYSWLRRLGLSIPAAAVGSNALYSIGKDPRYVSNAISVVIMPVLFFLLGRSIPIYYELAVPLTAFVSGFILLSAWSYDSSAVWMQITAGVRAVDDRVGRAVAALIWQVPAVLLVSVIAGIFLQNPAKIPGIIGYGLAILFIASAVSLVMGAKIPMPGPPPGASPLSTNTGSGHMGLIFLAMGLDLLGTVVLAIPPSVIYFAPIMDETMRMWVTLVGGPVYGALILWAGIRLSARLLAGNEAKILHTISSWTGHTHV